MAPAAQKGEPDGKMQQLWSRDHLDPHKSGKADACRYKD